MMYALALPPCSPAEIARRLCAGRGFFWLDGEADHAEGRWSFLGCEPVAAHDAALGAADPLSVMRALTIAEGDANSAAPLEGAPTAGEVPCWVGYVAYDAHLSPAAMRLPRASGQRVVYFARYPAVVALCGRSGRTFAVGDDAASCRALARRLEGPPERLPATRIDAISVTPREAHRAALEAALEHIAAGDVYQVNLARRWSAAFAGSPLALFLALREASPVPLGFFLDDGAQSVMSRTMERFLRFEPTTRMLRTRPIKGTRARMGRDHDEARQLAADPKERAEHAMIVDLMRNDLGRVARVGSVRVEQVMATEPYRGLWHLVSTVACQVAPEHDLEAILRATFPPGSVTGTPKLRAMALIEALETAARDVYTGAVGFVDRAGGLSLAVAIRTAIARGDFAHYWAGGGIVEASDIGCEIEETELKARVFLEAVRRLAGDFPLSTTALLR